MLEPPSDALVAGLAQLGLCRPSDWRRARSRVRRLTRDLPAFDSVWIDALVAQGRLTPFQAGLVEIGQLDQLQAGPCLLIDRLGHSGTNPTFLARDRQRGQLCVLKRVGFPVETAPETQSRLQQLVDRMSPLREPHVIGPVACHQETDSTVLVSPWVDGIPLSELLVRRGRFPATIVADIARQLLAGLSALHQRQITHGDVRLANVRLTSSGQAILVDAGVRPAMAPILDPRRLVTPEACDAVAPELIGSGLPFSPPADLYAVGCLLWQLLAGRPPFPVAEPLTRLAAHQTGRIPDIRDWAPDTPSPLAKLIHALTAPDPEDRPSGAHAVLEQIGWPGIATRQHLRRFRRQFDGAVPHLQAAESRRISGFAWAAAAVFLLSGLLMTFADPQRRGELLSLWTSPATAPAPELTESTRDESVEIASSQSPRNLLPLPDPDAQGLLTLGAGSYAPRNLTQVGPLTIRAAPGTKPTIQISDQSWQITARELSVDGISIRQQAAIDPQPPLRALLLVRAQSLAFENTSIAHSNDAGAHPAGIPSIAWTQVDRQDRQAGQALFRDVVATRPGPLLFCREAPRLVTVENCLKTDEGPAVIVYQSHSSRPIRLDLTRTTLRGSGPLLSLWGDFAEQTGAARLEINAVESVFAPQQSTPALIELAAERLRHDWAQAILWTGESSLLPEGTEIACYRDPVQRTVEVLPSTDLTVDGLTVDAFEFAGPSLTATNDSLLSASQAPRRSAEFPGFRPSE